MDIKRIGHIQAGTREQCTPLLELQSFLPLAQRVTSQGKHLEGASDGYGSVDTFCNLQAFLRRIIGFLIFAFVPVE